MPRNSEVTRQWQVLRDIDAARTGITIPKLAAARDVHQRTARAAYSRRLQFPVLRMVTAGIEAKALRSCSQ